MGEFYEHLQSTSTDSMSAPTYSWTCALVFIEIKWRFLLQCVPLCLRIYSGKQIKFSTFVSHDCALQTFWAPLDSREVSSSRPPFFVDSAEHFEDLKVCINGFGFFPSFLHVTHEVRLFSLLQNERFALELALWRVRRWMWVQHLKAEDGRKGNCWFTTLRNVNRKF